MAAVPDERLGETLEAPHHISRADLSLIKLFGRVRDQEGPERSAGGRLGRWRGEKAGKQGSHYCRHVETCGFHLDARAPCTLRTGPPLSVLGRCTVIIHQNEVPSSFAQPVVCMVYSIDP